MSRWMVAFLIVLGSGQESTASLIRNRRSIICLEEMVKCSTRLPGAIAILETYNCYGCYCGVGGVGQPVDPVDECCYEHDNCYSAAHNASGPCISILGQVYLEPYSFDCLEEHGKNQSTPVCKHASNKCADAICHCDAQLAVCLGKYEIKEKKKCPDKKRSCFGGFI